MCFCPCIHRLNVNFPRNVIIIHTTYLFRLHTALKKAKLDDKLVPGQTIAIQRDTFGAIVAEYKNSVEGKLAAARTDALSDPGNVLAFILFNAPLKAGDVPSESLKDAFSE